jgi:hypothetical protein
MGGHHGGALRACPAGGRAEGLTFGAPLPTGRDDPDAFAAVQQPDPQP